MHDSVREIALDLVRGDGRRLPVLVNAKLERDEAGRPRVVRIAVFDATERRGYERELLRAKEAAEASEERARELARTLQQTLIPPTPAGDPATWTWRRRTTPPARGSRSAATSTTCSRSVATTGWW